MKSGLMEKRVVHLLEGSSTEELTHATRLSLRRTGRRDVAYLLKEATTSTKRATKIKKIYHAKPKEAKPYTPEKRATKIKKIYHAKPKEAKPYTPEEALNLQVQLKLSKRDYQLLRSEAIERNCTIYP
ncbi:hypothetical protein QE152_g24845 [Popillia japonica]|uniref:Uncharacterized protein n=1 Tax=Popillia japonica TaxID=7064 RepID=A0AAW1K2B6_POPJA